MKCFKKIHIAVALMAVLSLGVFSTLTMAGANSEINIVPVKPEVTVGVAQTIRAVYTKGKAPDGMTMTVITEGAGSITDVHQEGNVVVGTWVPEIPSEFFSHAYITVSAPDGTSATTIRIISSE